MIWVEKNRKINNRGGMGGGGEDDYSGLESIQFDNKLSLDYYFSEICKKVSRNVML